MSATRWTLAIAAALAPLLSHASIVTYDFTATATSGTLAGTSSSGFLSYDSSIIPVSGGLVTGTHLITDLLFTWGGTTYDETTANTGGFIFDASGTPTTLLIGTNCAAGTCGVSGNSVGWYLRNDPGQITYSTGGGGIEYGKATFTLRDGTVPEPATAALAGLALAAALSATRARRRVT